MRRTLHLSTQCHHSCSRCLLHGTFWKSAFMSVKIAKKAERVNVRDIFSENRSLCS